MFFQGIHRAGLTKKLREEVEARFREGETDLLIATPTLELGIDIGDLDIVVTPPISVNRATQRIGRAGRKGQEAIAIIHLNSDDPINYATGHGITLKDGMVRVIITVDQKVTSRDFLSEYDLKDYQWRENFLTTYVSIDELKDLCKEPAVIYIRLPVKFDN